MPELRSQPHLISRRQGFRVLLMWLSFALPMLSATSTCAQQHPTDELRRLDESVDALIKRVSPSVV